MKKRVKPIEKNKKGEVVINLDSDAGNADWLSASRLNKEALKELHDTPMYKSLWAYPFYTILQIQNNKLLVA